MDKIIQSEKIIQSKDSSTGYVKQIEIVPADLAESLKQELLFAQNQLTLSQNNVNKIQARIDALYMQVPELKQDAENILM